MHRNHLGQNQNPWWKPHFCTRHNFTCHWQLPRDLWTHWHIVWELLAPVRFTGPKAKWQKFPTLWRNLSGDVPPYLKEKKAYHRIHGKDFGVFIWLAKHVYVNVCVCIYVYIYIYVYIHGWDIYSINIMQELHPCVHGQAYGQPTLVIIPNFLCLARLPSHPVTKFHAIVSDTIIHIR